MGLINDYVFKEIRSLSKRNIIVLILIYLAGLFLVYSILSRFVSPVIAVFLIGFATGYVCGFLVSQKYGKKINVILRRI